MMEPDAELYSPFLKELLAKPNVEMIDKSGIIWKDLFEMMQSKLSQEEIPRGETPRRNDTLLVTANLSMYPKKAFRHFDSVSNMILYQFMSSIRHSSLFQRYGVVRMLIWVNDEDKRRLLSKSLLRRRRGAFEAEISCDWVHEICGQDTETEDRIALRDGWIHLESAYNTAARMEEMGLKMPAGRETILHRQVMSDPSLQGQKLAGVHAPNLAKPYKQELEELEADHVKPRRGAAASKAKTPSVRLKALRLRTRAETGMAEQYLSLLQERDELFALAAAHDSQETALPSAPPPPRGTTASTTSTRTSATSSTTSTTTTTCFGSRRPRCSGTAARTSPWPPPTPTSSPMRRRRCSTSSPRRCGRSCASSARRPAARATCRRRCCASGSRRRFCRCSRPWTARGPDLASSLPSVRV